MMRRRSVSGADRSDCSHRPSVFNTRWGCAFEGTRKSGYAYAMHNCYMDHMFVFAATCNLIVTSSHRFTRLNLKEEQFKKGRWYCRRQPWAARGCTTAIVPNMSRIGSRLRQVLERQETAKEKIAQQDDQ